MPAVAAGPRHQPGRVEKSPFDRVPVCRSRIRALTVLVMITGESEVVGLEGPWFLAELKTPRPRQRLIEGWSCRQQDEHHQSAISNWTDGVMLLVRGLRQSCYGLLCSILFIFEISYRSEDEKNGKSTEKFTGGFDLTANMFRSGLFPIRSHTAI